MMNGWTELAGGLDWGAEAVHRLRVGIRREQARLRAVREAVDEAEAKRARRAWRRVMKAAGAVRNYDIAMGLARASGLDESSEAEFLWRRGANMRRLAEVVETTERPAIDWPPVTAEESSAGEVLDAFFAAGRRAEQDPTVERLHALRLAGKRFRYRLELAAETEGVARGLKRLKKLQDALGAINDCVTTQGLVEGGRFRAWLGEEVARRRGEFERVWDEWFKREEPWRALLEEVRSGSSGG